MTSQPLLSLQGIGKSVPSHQGTLHLLRDINLNVAPGDSLAIVGPSGSGKSTLLGIMAGLDTPSSGTVQLQGQPFSSLDEDTRAAHRARYMAFVFQSFQLVEDFNALENVLLPLELGGLSRKQAIEQARHWLTEVGLAERQQHFPQQLSGGEQQRVALARAFAVQPQLLFADEPTGSLDHANGQHISDLLFRLNEQSGTALVLVTHDLTLAQRCARQVHLHQGQLQLDQQATAGSTNDG